MEWRERAARALGAPAVPVTAGGVLLLLLATVGGRVAGGEGRAVGVEPVPRVARVLVVAADGLTPADLLDPRYPALHRLGEEGAAALLVSRTAGSHSRADAYLTLAAGARAAAPAREGQVYGAGEVREGQPAGLLYTRHTEWRPPPEALVTLDIPRIQYQAARLRHPVQPGLLGELLHRAGMRTAAVGNADTQGAPDRSAALLAADTRGLVDMGDVSAHTQRQDPLAPGGRRADPARLAEAAGTMLRRARLVVVDAGDPARLVGAGPEFTAPAWEEARARALAGLDQLLSRLEAAAPPGTLLAVVNPWPDPVPGVPAPFGLLVLKGSGLPPGRLQSPSTRWPGIVTNTDLAPTVLAALGVGGSWAMAGRPAVVVPRAVAGVVPGNGPGGQGPASTPEELEQSRERLTTLSARRPVILRVVVIGEMVLYGAALLLLAFWREPPARALSAIQVLVAATLLLPLAALALGAAPPPLGLAGVLALLAAGAGGGGLLLHRLSRGRPAVLLALAGAATVIALSLDVVRGSPWIRHSILGYDPLGGARFYGVGNEFMGFLVGAAIMAGSAGLSLARGGRASVLGVIAGFAGVVLTVGLPWLGANVGGALTAVAGTGVTTLLIAGRRLDRGTVAVTVALAVATVTALAWLDSHRVAGQAPSHLGYSLQAAAGGGVQTLLLTVQRKLELNLRLFRYSLWTRVFVLALVVLFVLFYRPAGLARRLWATDPPLARGFLGSTVASLTALVVNDSGVVAAATTATFATSGLLYLALAERRRAAVTAGPADGGGRGERAS